MKLLDPFDPSLYNPVQSSGQLPVGLHKVIIDESEVKPTKTADGGYVQLTLKIIEGPESGQTGAYRLHLYNASKKAVDMAKQQFSAVCYVLGINAPFDELSILHNLPFSVEVGMQRDSDRYTEVKRVFDKDGREPMECKRELDKPKDGETDVPNAWPVAGATPPWGKK